jgi:hypothetical protein
MPAQTIAPKRDVCAARLQEDCCGEIFRNDKKHRTTLHDIVELPLPGDTMVVVKTPYFPIHDNTPAITAAIY